MSTLRILLSRISALFRKRSMEQELDDELQFHLQHETEALVAQGMSPEQARRAALKRFGTIEGTKEAYRDAQRLPIVESLVRDLGYSLRTLRQSPGFTAVAVISLALGIGANTAVFTIVNRALLTALPVKDPDQIVALAPFRQQRQSGLGYPVFEAIVANQKTLSVMAASGSLRLTDVVYEGKELQELNS